MEDESGSTSMYFCHMCSLIIRPVTTIAELKCPHCHTGFVEETAAGQQQRSTATTNRDWPPAAAEATERDVSLWAPVLMDFLAASSGSGHDRLDGDLAAFARRQYRNIALMQLLTALQEQEADVGGLTLGDMFLGPGMDLLLEYLAENDPSRQGTAPARKEAVAALPTVRVREAATCPVCLDELAKGREMPCKHVFHEQCIVPWLEMHSSCPVCRYQLPTAEEPATGSGSGHEPRVAAARRSDAGSGGRRHWFSWPFGWLFSQRSNGNSSSSS